MHYCLLGRVPASIDLEWGYRDGLVSVVYLAAFLTNDKRLDTRNQPPFSSILNNDLWEEYDSYGKTGPVIGSVIHVTAECYPMMKNHATELMSLLHLALLSLNVFNMYSELIRLSPVCEA